MGQAREVEGSRFLLEGARRGGGGMIFNPGGQGASCTLGLRS